MTPALAAKRSLQNLSGMLRAWWPGVIAVIVAAVAAQFLSDHYGAPAMLMALLIGISLNFLSERAQTAPGIGLCARTVLRIGVALLGMRISVDMLLELGWRTVLLLALAIAATILFGLGAARLLRRDWRLALITAGSVAICGASAAMAIAAVLPKNEFSERNLVFTVLSVTVLSTMAMIGYPMLAHALSLDPRAAGVFFGGSIHDVAQVVGAGFSVSPEVGETATLVKLIRVAMLAPVVLVVSLATHRFGDAGEAAGKRPPLLPGFVLVFLLLAALNSVGLLPQVVTQIGKGATNWALLVGIVAVGMKTSLRRVLEVGGRAIALVVVETVFIGLFILAGVYYLGL